WVRPTTRAASAATAASSITPSCLWRSPGARRRSTRPPSPPRSWSSSRSGSSSPRRPQPPRPQPQNDPPLTRRPVMVKAKTRKVCTVEQANATLPLVRAIVRDLTALAVDLRERHERLRHAPEGAALSPDHEEELAQARAALERDLERLRELEDELTALGVEMKD